MNKTAVLFIIFNRPESTEKVFEAIKAARPEKLYIAADAPRISNVDDIEKCKKVRALTENIDWPCEVHRLYQKENLGCGLGVRTSFDWFFSEEKEGIILEDDCVPNLSFFPLASEMLEKFRDNKKVISINGSNLGYQLKNGDSYTYSRFMNMWGWATWADRANEIDYNMESWKRIKNPHYNLYKKLRRSLFDFDFNWYKYWQHKFDFIITNPNFTWDWQWIWHQINNEKISIVPRVNLVSNIGFDENATHTHHADNPSSNIPSEEIKFPLSHPKKIKIDFAYEEYFVKWVWCYHRRLPVVFYIKNTIKRLLKSN